MVWWASSSMSDPSHVVSTLNRYVFLDSPHVAFLHRIALQRDQGDSHASPSLSIKLTFTFQHSKHSVFLRLHPPPTPAIATSSSPPPSTVSSAEDWTIGSIAATHQDLVTEQPAAQLCSAPTSAYSLCVTARCVV